MKLVAQQWKRFVEPPVEEQMNPVASAATAAAAAAPQEPPRPREAVVTQTSGMRVDPARLPRQYTKWGAAVEMLVAFAYTPLHVAWLALCALLFNHVEEGRWQSAKDNAIAATASELVEADHAQLCATSRGRFSVPTVLVTQGRYRDAGGVCGIGAVRQLEVAPKPSDGDTPDFDDIVGGSPISGREPLLGKARTPTATGGAAAASRPTPTLAFAKMVCVGDDTALGVGDNVGMMRTASGVLHYLPTSRLIATRWCRFIAAHAGSTSDRWLPESGDLFRQYFDPITGTHADASLVVLTLGGSDPLDLDAPPANATATTPASTTGEATPPVPGVAGVAHGNSDSNSRTAKRNVRFSEVRASAEGAAAADEERPVATPGSARGALKSPGCSGAAASAAERTARNIGVTCEALAARGFMVIVNVPPVPYRVHEKTLPEATCDAFHRRSAAIRSELALRFGISFAHADQVVSAKARVRAGVDMAAGTYTWRLYTFDGLNFNPEGYREMARRLEAPVFLAMRALEAARLEREFTGVR